MTGRRSNRRDLSSRSRMPSSSLLRRSSIVSGCGRVPTAEPRTVAGCTKKRPDRHSCQTVQSQAHRSRSPEVSFGRWTERCQTIPELKNKSHVMPGLQRLCEDTREPILVSGPYGDSIAFSSLRATRATKSWANFRNDPEWKKVAAASKANGKIVERRSTRFSLSPQIS